MAVCASVSVVITGVPAALRGAPVGIRARAGGPRTMVVAEQSIEDGAVAYGVPGAGVAELYRSVRRRPRRRRRNSRCRSI